MRKLLAGVVPFLSALSFMQPTFGQALRFNDSQGHLYLYYGFTESNTIWMNTIGLRAGGNNQFSCDGRLFNIRSWNRPNFVLQPKQDVNFTFSAFALPSEKNTDLALLIVDEQTGTASCNDVGSLIGNPSINGVARYGTRYGVWVGVSAESYNQDPTFAATVIVR